MISRNLSELREAEAAATTTATRTRTKPRKRRTRTRTRTKTRTANKQNNKTAAATTTTTTTTTTTRSDSNERENPQKQGAFFLCAILAALNKLIPCDRQLFQQNIWKLSQCRQSCLRLPCLPPSDTWYLNTSNSQADSGDFRWDFKGEAMATSNRILLMEEIHLTSWGW